MSTVIKIKGLSKKYILNHSGSKISNTSFRETITNSLRFKKSSESKKDFWALRDLNLEINQGDRLGIIGRNGAGKSTLLKVLSRITEPTHGQIKTRGKVASLLEVGTGFHPELTGRENIFLNGAILGMSRDEIRRKFDEIVSFAEVTQFLDTPVKRYSSGMYVRLAFSVAAHLEPDILIVDEVLAVGDAQFQKKCLGKMEDVGREGRTVLFVSHHMGSIERLCNTGLLLHNGEIKYHTREISKLQAEYYSLSQSVVEKSDISSFKSDFFSPTQIYIKSNNAIVDVIRNDQDSYLFIEGVISKTESSLQIGYSLFDEGGRLIYWSYHTDTAEKDWLKLTPGFTKLKTKLPRNLLNEGKYRIEVGVALYCKEWIFEPGVKAPGIDFEIQGGLSSSIYWTFKRPGLLAPINEWVKLE